MEKQSEVSDDCDESHVRYHESWVNPHPRQRGELQEYFIGDAYDRYEDLKADRWSHGNENDGPYLRRVKYLARSGWPQLRYLADFIECSTTPIKGKMIVPADREERQMRCHTAIVDLQPGKDLSVHEFSSATSLTTFLDQEPWIDAPGYTRLIVIEDLSTTSIELLGSRFNLDPQFFRSHISDYTWYNVQDPWFDMPTLPSRAESSPHFTFRHLQPYYFRNAASAERARRRAGGFNVLRRVDFHKSSAWADRPGSSVGNVRSATSIYIRPQEEAGQGWLGFLLVDPPIREGYPLWAGFDNIRCPPTYMAHDIYEQQPNPHLFESPMQDFLYFIRTMPSKELNLVRLDNALILSPIFSCIPAQWLLSFEHISNRLSLIEWEVERKEHRTAQSLDDALQRLHPWRRNVANFGNRIRTSIETMQRFRRQSATLTSETTRQWDAYTENFIDLERRCKVLDVKIDKIVMVLTTVMNIEDTKKQMVSARDVARITYLAFFYIPFSFVASVLSMNESIFEGNLRVYWILFVIAVPLTTISLVIAIYWTLLKQASSRTSNGKSEPAYYPSDRGIKA